MLEYRFGVIGVFINEENKLLVCERSDFPGAWQFPQGGIEPGEGAIEAFYREMNEELGTSKFAIIREGRRQVRYRFPDSIDSKIAKKYCGQSLQWFLASFKEGKGPKIEKADGEFKNFTWKTPQEVLELIVDWKRKAYEEGFSQLRIDFV